jgi:hypothetical protein
MLAVVALSSSSYAPPAVISRPAVRCDAPLMLEESSTRRELFARAGAAVLGVSAVQSASAKAGQFSKLSVFDIVGEPSLSSPFQAGGPQGDGPGTTFGYKKSDGPILASGYKSDVSREKAAFSVSSGIVRAQGPNIDTKTWWLVRDNLRGQAYNMKANMIAINGVLGDDKKAKATKAYKKFWDEINQLDLACVKKEYDLAKKEYDDVLAALAAYESAIA